MVTGGLRGRRGNTNVEERVIMGLYESHMHEIVKKLFI